MKFRILLLLLVWGCTSPAQAGLFTDESTLQEVKELKGRVELLEDSDKQRTRSMMDMQSQLDALQEEVRDLKGQNQELQHELQDAEKRQKDFYVDLDSRLRRLEGGGAPVTASGVMPAGGSAATGAPVPIDPVAEDRDYDAAYSLFKANKLQASIAAFIKFLQKYPNTTLAPNAYYRIGVAYFGLKDYKNAVNSYLTLANKYPSSASAPNALLAASICYQSMGDKENARKALQQILSSYPNSSIAPRAKKRLETLK